MVVVSIDRRRQRLDVLRQACSRKKSRRQKNAGKAEDSKAERTDLGGWPTPAAEFVFVCHGEKGCPTLRDFRRVGTSDDGIRGLRCRVSLLCCRVESRELRDCGKSPIRIRARLSAVPHSPRRRAGL
jgi:hypothetical protein